MISASIRQECRNRAAQQHHRSNCGRSPRLPQIHSRDLRLRWQVVCARISPDDEHRVGSADAGIRSIVKSRILHATFMQLRHSRLSFGTKLRDLAKFYRPGRARMRTRWHHARLLAVIAEGAFEGATVILITLDNSEWACNNTIRAAVANVRL